MSFVMYFEYLSPPAGVVHVDCAPPRHDLPHLPAVRYPYEPREAGPEVETGEIGVSTRRRCRRGRSGCAGWGPTRPPRYARLGRSL